MGGDEQGPEQALDDLCILVARAHAAPNTWHGVPEYPLELRVTPCGGSLGGSDFEIRCAKRDAKSVSCVRGYRCASPAAAPKRISHSHMRVLHENLSLAEFPHDEEAFADAISKSLGARRRERTHVGGRTGSMTWSGLLYRLYISTFGSSELPWWQRISIALAGSMTFFAALLAHFAVTLPEWYKQIQIWDELEDTSDSFLLNDGGVTTVVLGYGAFFALLCAWKIGKIGPLRLYALSFFFPYLFWISIMRMGVDPELGAQGAGADPAETMSAENQ